MISGYNQLTIKKECSNEGSIKEFRGNGNSSIMPCFKCPTDR